MARSVFFFLALLGLFVSDAVTAGERTTTRRLHVNKGATKTQRCPNGASPPCLHPGDSKGSSNNNKKYTTDNLLVNPDAETHRCTNDWTAQTSLPGWEVLRGAASILCYSAFNWTNETIQFVPQGATAAVGQALFAAPGIDTALRQTVNVMTAAKSIDNNVATFQVSGWLGGWRNRPERALLTLTFMDMAGKATGNPVVISAVSQANSMETALFQQSSSGHVPPKTRTIVVTLDLPSGIGSYHNAFADNLSLVLSGPNADIMVPTGTATIPPSSVPPLDHVFILMVENTNFADVVDFTSGQVNPIMPYLASLAANGVTLTNMWGTYHPSDENYVAMVAGDTFKYGPTYFPDFNLTVNHLGDLLEAQGKTWKAYAQSMNTSCNLVSSGYYYPDDQPFVAFTNVIDNPVRCNNTVVDLTQLPLDAASNALPNYAFLGPDNYYEGEAAWFINYDVSFANQIMDKFMQLALEPLFASQAWLTSRSIVIITWDESGGWGWPDNHVPTFVVGSQPGLIKSGQSIDTHYNGYDILRTVAEALQVESLGRFDQFAKPFNDVFAENPSLTTGLRLTGTAQSATRGRIADTFGQVTTPVAVVAGNTLELAVVGMDQAAAPNARVILTPLGSIPRADSTRFNVDSNGKVSIPTDNLPVGIYAAWLSEDDELPPSQAALPVSILSESVQPDAPGVEIWTAVPTATASNSSSIHEIRQGANVVLHYCRPNDATANNTWIGMFPSGASNLTKNAASGIWMRTPGDDPSQSCGHTWAQTSELTPSQIYDIFLLVGDGATNDVVVGSSTSFTVTPALPA